MFANLVSACNDIPQGVSSTAAKGPPKPTSRAAHHNVAHTPSKVTDLFSNAYLVLLLGAGLAGGRSCRLSTCTIHTASYGPYDHMHHILCYHVYITQIHLRQRYAGLGLAMTSHLCISIIMVSG